MAIATPKGYGSTEEFLKEARERFQEAVDFDRENREEAQTDLKFLAGDQWEPDDVASRKGLPCLTINDLPQKVAQVVGDIRINKPAIKARPAEDADKDLASLREGLIRAIEHDSKAQQIYAAAGQSQVACGIGHFQVRLEYASDEVFERNIRIAQIPNPFAVAWDPGRIEPTGADAAWCFVHEDIPRKVFEARYPDKVPSDLGADLTAELTRSGWQSRDTVRVSAYWVMKEAPAELIMLRGGAVKDLTAENRAELMPLADTNSRGQPMIRKTTRKRACVYLITGHDILEEPEEYPINRIPVFRVAGWEVNTGEKTVRFGLVRFARDPARLKNFWRSVQAQKLALAPRQQWLKHEQTAGDSEDFRTAAENGDTVLLWGGQNEPKRLEPPAIEVALIQASEQNSQDMKDVTGLHDASLGIKSNETSGVAINARKEEGDVASYIYHDNLHSAIAAGGDVVNQMIPFTHDTMRTIRILGEDEQQKIQRINDPNDPNSVDIAKGKYDIVVDTGPSYTTKRQEAAESMRDYFQVVPAAAAVAGDLYAKAMDFPLAEEVGDRVKKTLPPGMVEEDDKDLSPEQKQAREQQQMQAQQQQEMQQHAAELELNDAAATVELKHAQAVKTLAEARALAAGEPEAPIPEPDPPEPFEVELAEAALEKARADAVTAGIKAEREKVALQADIADLSLKPLEQAHSKADLKIKLNPPVPGEGEMTDTGDEATDAAPTLGQKLIDAQTDMAKRHSDMAEQMAKSHAEGMSQLAAAIEKMAAPKRIIRGDDGRAIGTAPMEAAPERPANRVVKPRKAVSSNV